MLDFIDIRFVDLIDIALVALLIYQIYRIIKGTAALGIFLGIIFLYVVWLVVKALDMKLLSTILGQILGVGLLALIILFQQEIRRFLLRLGSTYVNNSHSTKFIKKIFGYRNHSVPLETLDEVTQACRRMSETHTGALIVLAHVSSLNFVVETGDVINAKVNRRLLENIFFKNAPLHDGAIVLSANKIVAARCTLPISETPNIPPRYGMRHKAAIGLTEETDASVIVVSEETGEISFVQDGKIETMNSISELRLRIEGSFK
ncbi:MAG: diadenylate cyclase CdaA [Bacteroidales bacterium]|jgi:uncharacterized protein (TIGR00159 family)|nr:diadenylate cyclase CdaA [Bacteroidales bacterium]